MVVPGVVVPRVVVPGVVDLEPFLSMSHVRPFCGGVANKLCCCVGALLVVVSQLLGFFLKRCEFLAFILENLEFLPMASMVLIRNLAMLI